MPLRCPVCKAENATPPACRRCKADLSLLFALEDDRAALMARARHLLAEGRWQSALGAATKADHLRRDAESGKLVALASLLCSEYRSAWRAYQRAAR